MVAIKNIEDVTQLLNIWQVYFWNPFENIVNMYFKGGDGRWTGGEEDNTCIIIKPCYLSHKVKPNHTIYSFWILIRELVNMALSDNHYWKEEKVDNMTHHFIECSGLNNFWNVFEIWWNRTATYPIQLSNKLIMFGIYYDNTFYKKFNYVILLAKWYKHRQVYLKWNIDFFNFLIVLKRHLDTGKYIYAHVMVDCILLTYNGLRYMNVFNWLLFNTLLNFCLCLVYCNTIYSLYSFVFSLLMLYLLL